MDFHTQTGRSLTFVKGFPCTTRTVFQTVFLQTVIVTIRNNHHIERFLALKSNRIPGHFHFRIRIPAGPEIIVIGKVHDSIVTAPCTFGRLIFGNVGRYNRSIRFGNRCYTTVVLPQFTYFLQSFQGVGIHQAVSVGSYVQDKVTIGFAHRDDIIIDHLCRRLHRGSRETFFPEPVLL